MTSNEQDDLQHAEEAAAWLIRLEEEGPACHAAFEAWITTDPRHREEFLAVFEMSSRWRKFDPRHEIDVTRHIARAAQIRQSAPTATSLQNPNRRHRFNVLSPAAVVAAIATALLAWATLWLVHTRSTPPAAQTYATAIGEQRKVTLTDGSIIHLNTNSEVRVHYTNAERSVALLQGEALFSVAHDVLRPFRVQTRLNVIEVLGTEFDINQQTPQTTISVIAGKVSVLFSREKEPQADSDRQQYAPPSAVTSGAASPRAVNSTTLTAGQQVSVNPDGHLGKVETSDPTKVLLWREGRLIFDQTPLEQVVEEFNRYNTTQLIVKEEVLRSRPVSGIFSTKHPETLVRDLQSKDHRIAADRQNNTLILHLK